MCRAASEHRPLRDPIQKRAYWACNTIAKSPSEPSFGFLKHVSDITHTRDTADVEVSFTLGATCRLYDFRVHAHFVLMAD
jgi:hypothetical protein